MNFASLTRFSPLALIPIFFACGVDVYHSSPTPVDHYVSMTLSETNGRRDILANECIDMWDTSRGGSIEVDSPWLSSDLRIDWEKFAGRLDIQISDAFGLIGQTNLAEEFFQNGGSSEMKIATEGKDYLLQLTGPYCNERL